MEEENLNDETFNVSADAIGKDFNFGGALKTLEEIELEMMNGSSVPDHQPKQSEPTDDRYNGLMLQYEKDLVQKIQLSLIASDPTYEKDFYCKAHQFNQRRKNPQVQEQHQQEEKYRQLLKEVRSHNQRRISKSSDQKKILGKIVQNTLRQPKRLLEVAPADASKLVPENQKLTKFSPRHVLQCIEECYRQLIILDDLYRQFQADTQPPSEQVKNVRNTQYTRSVKTIWTQLHSLSVKPPTELLKLMPSPAGISMFLAFSKGRRIIPHIMRYLPKDQILLFLRCVVLSIRSVVMGKDDSPQAMLQELDEYTNFAVLPFVNVFGEAQMDYLNSIVEALLQSGDMVALARTKPGLLFLTLIISRAEIIKNEQVVSPEVSRWDSEFPTLFAAFQTRFTSLFPPAQIMPSLFGRRSSKLQQPIQIDDTYVWQFLAALSAVSSEEQHRILVTETRDKIYETITTQGEVGKSKANIFLHALDLDASQLL